MDFAFRRMQLSVGIASYALVVGLRNMELDGVFYVLGLIFGWPLRWFRRWLDQQPNREASQISTLRKGGRLALGMSISLSILAALAWVIWR